jgi:hypothetical protein
MDNVPNGLRSINVVLSENSHIKLNAIDKHWWYLTKDIHRGAQCNAAGVKLQIKCNCLDSKKLILLD